MRLSANPKTFISQLISKPVWLLAITIVFFSSSCKMMKNIEEITDNANQILEELADLSMTVNTAVETEALDDRVGALVDDRIDKMTESINAILQENSGMLFDEVNGTIDNTFDNTRNIIDDIKTGILDESLPQTIELLSGQLERQTNNLAGHAENLINLTFGNTSMILSQATDAAFTLSVWIIFGVGLLILIVVLIVWGRRMTRSVRTIVLVLMGIFVVTSMSILFIPPVKGLVLKSLNIGKEFTSRALEPRALAATPANFELGTDDKLIVYGTHLDMLNRDSIEIGLYQSGNRKLLFPKNTIKVITGNKIVMSGFSQSTLRWMPLRYIPFMVSYKKKTGKSLPANYSSESKKIYIKNFQSNPKYLHLYKPKTRKKVPIKSSTPFKKKSNFKPMYTQPLVMGKFGTQFGKDFKDLAFGKYKIAPGDYELRLTHKQSGKLLGTVLHIRVDNPPPPPPKPDLFPISVNWLNGLPVKGDKAQLNVVMGVVNGSEVNRNSVLSLSSATSLPGLRPITVSQTAIRNSGNTISLTSRAFTVPKAGNVGFQLRADATNKVAEMDESNNNLSKSLRARDYGFKATVTFSSFMSTKDLDNNLVCGSEEYRIDILTAVSRHADWKIDFNKGGASANTSYRVGNQRNYGNLREGDVITLTTTGYEKGDCLEGDEGMGSDYKMIKIENSKVYPIQLRAKHYILTGEVKVLKVVKN